MSDGSDANYDKPKMSKEELKDMYDLMEVEREKINKEDDWVD